MANAVEKLFDSVLSDLGPEKEDPVLDPRGSENDTITTLEENEAVDRAIDRIVDGRQPPLIDRDEEEAAEGGLRKSGLDVLAFYKSKRYLDRRPYIGKWGIFYIKQGLQFVEISIAREYPGYGDTRSLALNFLREHERFHFRADLQALMFEAVTKKHLYGPSRRLFRSDSTAFVEEALANRQVWDWVKRRNVGIKEFAYDFMKLQPDAYARFDEPRLNLAAEWATNVVDLVKFPVVLRHDLAHWVEATPSDLLRPALCPEYVVTPLNLQTWLPSALVTPPVSCIVDSDEVLKRLNKKYQNLRDRWARTKEKLIENRLRGGLNFKPWTKDTTVKEAYSVKVDDGFRAHLKHEGAGLWTAYIIGTHKELGHG